MNITSPVNLKQDRIAEVLEAYLLLKLRVYLDTQRNKLFKFLDTKSKRLDALTEIKIRNFDISQYAMFRDITEPGRLGEYGVRLETRLPIVKNKTKQVDFTDDDPWTFEDEEYY